MKSCAPGIQPQESNLADLIQIIQPWNLIQSKRFLHPEILKYSHYKTLKMLFRKMSHIGWNTITIRIS
jgi:hypothetical protein